MNRRGFTLVELFVVLALTAVVVGIAVPAFTGLIRSSNRSFSENAIQVAVSVARDVATRDSRDTGVVFLHDPDGRVRIAVVAKVGEFDDLEADTGENVNGQHPFDPASFGSLGSSTPTIVRRELFAPVDDAPSLELAPGYMARGYLQPYAFLATRDTVRTWYDSNAWFPSDFGIDGPGATAGNALNEANWVEPESGYYDPDDAGFFDPIGGPIDDRHRTGRSSFMLRFEADTGKLVRAALPALVLDPRPVLRTQQDPAYMTIMPDANVVSPGWWRVEQSDSLFRWAESVLRNQSLPYWDTSGRQTTDVSLIAYGRSRLIGLYSNDTVLCGPVARVALYREVELAQAIGGTGVNPITKTIYAPYKKFNEIRLDTREPATVDGVRYRAGVLNSRVSEDELLRQQINLWVAGDTSGPQGLPDGAVNEFDDPAAQIFMIDDLSGEIREVVR